MRTPRSNPTGTPGTTLPCPRTAISLAAGAALAALACLPCTSWGQTTAPEAERVDNPVLPSVVVTGSNIRRADTQGALPVTVLDRADIERSGFATATELLQRLPQAGSGSASQGGNVGGFTPGGENIALRDLGASATLVLLNGRRLPTYAFSSIDSSFVSLDQIPASAIQRIEVLRDGASSIYGSDAIAGVVNIITRKDYRGAEVFLRQGNAIGRSNPRETTFSASGGYGTLEAEGFNGLITYEHVDRSRLGTADRSYAASSDLRSRGGADRRLPFSDPANAFNATTFDVLQSPACPPERRGAQFCLSDFTQWVTSIPKSKRDAINAIGTVALGGKVQGFTEVLLGRQESRSRTSPDIIAGITAGSVDQLVPAGARGNPFGTAVLPLGLLPGAQPRQESVVTESGRVLLGVRGGGASYDWEAALAASQGRSKQSLSNQFRSTELNAALASGAVSPFGTVSNDPAQIDAITGTTQRTSASRMQEADARITGELIGLPAGALDGSVGTSFRHESLADRTDPNFVNFANGVDYGSRDGARDISALYAELVIPVLRSLSIQASARYDHYSDFGNTTNPKLAVRWQPAEGVLLRGSAGSGFRAPSLSQLQPAAAPVFGNGVLDPRRCPTTGSPLDCAGTVGLISGGNTDLDAETSRSASLGIVLDVLRNATLSIDGFSIDYRDQIRQLDVDTILRDELSSTSNLVVRNAPTAADTAAGLPGSIQSIRTVPFNVARSKIRGVDVDLSTRWSLGEGGLLRWNTIASMLTTNRVRNSNGEAYTTLLGTFNHPRLRAQSAVDWQLGGWGVGLIGRYTGGFTDGTAGANGEVLKIGSFTRWDLSVSWRLFNGFTLNAGVNNLFDRRSPYSNLSLNGNAPNGDLIGRWGWLSARWILN